MKRVKRSLLAALLVLVTGMAAATAYSAAARDREYRRLLASGDAALAAGRLTLAIEAFSGALTLKPTSMAGHLKRAAAYQQQGDVSAALRDLQTAHALDRAAPRPLEQLGDLNYALGRYRRAAGHYAACIELDDRSPDVLYKLGLAFYGGGDVAAAVTALRRSVALNERFAAAYYVLGVALRAEGKTGEAGEALRRAVTLAPQLAAAREALASLHRLLGETREALEQHEALAALEPDRPARLLSVALAQSDSGRTDLAVRLLGRVARRFPELPAVYATLGEVWLRAAERGADHAALSKAVEALRTAVVRGASGGRELGLYGRAMLLSGNSAEALRALREAALSRPVAPDTFIWLAQAAERAGRTREARDALLRHAALASGGPPAPVLAARIGDLSARLREPGMAARWLTRAAESPDADPSLLFRLAEAERDAGDTEAARRTVVRGLTRAPEDARLKRLQEALDVPVPKRPQQ